MSHLLVITPAFRYICNQFIISKLRMQNIDLPFDKYDFKSASILDDLPKEDLSLLNKNAVTHSYRRGEMVFRERSIPTGIYFLKKGKIKKYKTDKDGREQIFYVCNS